MKNDSSSRKRVKKNPLLTVTTPYPYEVFSFEVEREHSCSRVMEEKGDDGELGSPLFQLRQQKGDVPSIVSGMASFVQRLSVE